MRKIPPGVMSPGRDVGGGDGEFLLVRKPAGWTSFDVVKKIRHLVGVRKVGHAGTLDPLATGLMIVCTGKRTRELGTFSGLDKEYRVTMMLGERTESQDAATPVIERRSTGGITEAMVRETVASFAGPGTQVPPMWSAVKVGGRRLYHLARKGVEVERAPRPIVVYSITPDSLAIPVVSMTVACSKGTYVRTLVHDIGERLGCGAHVTALERTRIGNYRLEDALTLEELARICSQENGAAV